MPELAKPYGLGSTSHRKRHPNRGLGSQKIFRRKDDAEEDRRDSGDRCRGNDTYPSTSDPETRLYRQGQGQEAGPAWLEHVLVENRRSLIADAMADPARRRRPRACHELPP